MATKKKDTPANYDRWDTIPGAMKVVKEKNTPTQQKAIDAMNAEYAKKQAAKKKKAAAKK